MMLKSRLFLILAVLVSVWLLVVESKPVKGKQNLLNKIFKNKFHKLKAKRSFEKCQDGPSDETQLINFSNDVAVAFLNSGDLTGLDNLLKYLSESECFSNEELKDFHDSLINIYNLIYSEHSKTDEQLSEEMKKILKRGKHQDLYHQMKNLISELIAEGDQSAIDLLTDVHDHIQFLHDSGALTDAQASDLLKRINHFIGDSRVNGGELMRFGGEEQM